jgi:hypothetical protein
MDARMLVHVHEYDPAFRKFNLWRRAHGAFRDEAEYRWYEASDEKKKHGPQ